MPRGNSNHTLILDALNSYFERFGLLVRSVETNYQDRDVRLELTQGATYRQASGADSLIRSLDQRFIVHTYNYRTEEIPIEGGYLPGRCFSEIELGMTYDQLLELLSYGDLSRSPRDPLQVSMEFSVTRSLEEEFFNRKA